jgi:hypothetical protein
MPNGIAISACKATSQWTSSSRSPASFDAQNKAKLAGDASGLVIQSVIT